MTPDTVAHWERKGLILALPREAAEHRRFSVEEVNRVWLQRKNGHWRSVLEDARVGEGLIEPDLGLDVDWVNERQLRGVLGLEEADLNVVFGRAAIRLNRMFSPPRVNVDEYAKYYVACSGKWGLRPGVLLTEEEAAGFYVDDSEIDLSREELIVEVEAKLELDKSDKNFKEWQQEWKAVAARIRAFLAENRRRGDP